MNTQNNGGSAFPESYEGAQSPNCGIGGGMTLRDYFAGQALIGWRGNYLDALENAKDAYALADAMLLLRQS
jgi:hypothetical protein